MNKQEIINKVMKVEGGFSDEPLDSGGRTNFGITWRVAKKHGFDDVSQLKAMDAFSIYSKEYWDSNSLGSVLLINACIAEEMFDTGVNMGTGRAAEFLQRCLNVLNNRGKNYDDVVVDRDIGPATISALMIFKKQRGDKGMRVLLSMLNSLQGAFYVSLAERRSKDERFIFGWFDNRVIA